MLPRRGHHVRRRQLLRIAQVHRAAPVLVRTYTPLVGVLNQRPYGRLMATAYGWSADPHPHGCLVCGWDFQEPSWSPAPLYLICHCCGSESGVDDLDERRAAESLLRWVARGAPWFVAAERPDGWSVSRCLADVRIEVRRRELRKYRDSDA